MQPSYSKATLCVGLLILWRMLHQWVLYDPLIAYYQGAITPQQFPQVQPIGLMCSWGLLYYLNSMTSLALLYVWFRESRSIKFLGLCYALMGLVLLVGTLFMVQFFGSKYPMLIFQLRRFLIYPILLLVFFPALYYQKQLKAKSS